MQVTLSFLLKYLITGIDEFNDPKLSLEQALIDPQRIDYYFRHLLYLRRAIKSVLNFALLLFTTSFPK